MKRVAWAIAALSLASEVSANSFAEHGVGLDGAPDSIVNVSGGFRTRAALLYNLDLDRGVTPSGAPLFPVPLDDPKGQTLTHADLRLRTDLSLVAPGGGAQVKLRVDALDNVALGGRPEGLPTGTTSQAPSEDTIRVKRVWGEALTPLGVLAVGRMGSHWGLGMLTNAGDCADCDSGDAADRIAFVTPLGGHLWAAAYDFSATGPFVPARSGQRLFGVAPSAQVHTLTFAAMKYRSEFRRELRRRADKHTIDYGAYLSRRWQSSDVPAQYLPTAQPVRIDSSQVMSRGYTATAADLWLRWVLPDGRIEIEGAYLDARIEQPSLIPGVLARQPATSQQLGVALQTELAPRGAALSGGLDGGYASGDSAPGFGAFPEVTAPAPQPGDLDGAQANPPYDTTVNNFRFHPDYRIDRILFREIIGTVTDAVYVRPHLTATLFDLPSGRLAFDVAVVASWAVNAESAPGGQRPLGVEIDPTLVYRSRDGFELALEQATLFPLSGLDNPALGLDAKPAQLWRTRVAFYF